MSVVVLPRTVGPTHRSAATRTRLRTARADGTLDSKSVVSNVELEVGKNASSNYATI